MLQRKKEPWRWEVQGPAIRSWQRPTESHHWNWFSYKYMRNCQGTPHRPSLWSFSIWSTLERRESLVNGCLMHCPQNQKLLFWSIAFSYSMQQQTISQDCDMMKSAFYMITSDDQLSDWTKNLQSSSQSQTCTLKRSWSLFGGLLPVWCTTAFWILAKPLHLRSMLSKLMWCTKNCNSYS